MRYLGYMGLLLLSVLQGCSETETDIEAADFKVEDPARLANTGYVVAALNHHGNTAAEAHRQVAALPLDFLMKIYGVQRRSRPS